ncbi:histone deacetylase [Streptomyces chrestomyceticus]|uniref:histone deacetylase n=1 Tax=Streptomyces chrestomyceticus TaxID=68185 RepID=UPI003410243A
MHVWYVSYGSNMHGARLRHYLTGGRPPGGLRTCPGCRDPRPPARSVPVVLPGTMYFALESLNWTGGVAFYDPDGPGEVWARAHLVTRGQFSDIAAQEMHRVPAADLDLAEVLDRGRAQFGPGRYETLVHPGALDGLPLLTFTAPWGAGEVPRTQPTDAYLAHLSSGLREAGGWDDEQITEYLDRCRLGLTVRPGTGRRRRRSGRGTGPACRALEVDRRAPEPEAEDPRPRWVHGL